MGHFTAAEGEKNFYFITLLQKSNRVAGFCLEIIVIDIRMHLDFLDLLLDLLAFRFPLTLALLILELAKVHDAADRRINLAGDFHQVQSSGVRALQGGLEA